MSAVLHVGDVWYAVVFHNTEIFFIHLNSLI